MLGGLFVFCLCLFLRSETSMAFCVTGVCVCRCLLYFPVLPMSSALTFTHLLVSCCNGVCVCVCEWVTMHIHLYMYFADGRPFSCDTVWTFSWWLCPYCITLFWHNPPWVSVVSVSLPPSLLLLVSNRTLFLCPFTFFCLYLSSVAPHLFWGGFLVPLCPFFLSFCTYLSPSTPLPHPSIVLSPWFLCVFTTLVYFVALCVCVCACVRVCVRVCVFSVLVQQRRRGKQRGSNLSVCTLSSLSRLSLSLFFLSL